MDEVAAVRPRRAALARRFWLYQRERFPLAVYAPLVVVFTFSAAAYARLIRGAPGFIRGELFAAGAFTALVFFFLLRVLDEHKDAALDRSCRPELPVPRGLIDLRELRWIGGAAAVAALVLNALLAPVLLGACLAVAAWMALMSQEFFLVNWLRARPAAYLVSHMAILPMIDGYTTGLDWLAAGVRPPPGLGFFLAVTFLNGTVMEVGRKIRAPEEERTRVETYTQVWGVRAAPLVWLAVLAGTTITANFAARSTGAGAGTAALLFGFVVVAAVPAFAFLQTRRAAWAKGIKTASELWTLAIYLTLGTSPFLARWLGA